MDKLVKISKTLAALKQLTVTAFNVLIFDVSSHPNGIVLDASLASMYFAVDSVTVIGLYS